LVVDTDLETGWAPVNELNGSLGLDGGNSGVDVLWNDITSVHAGDGHVFTVSWVALGHSVCWFEDGIGDFSNGELFVIGFLSRDDWSIGVHDEMDTWVWDEIGLEFSDIDVKSTIESEGSSQTGDDLSDKSVKVGVGWSFDIEVSSADIVDSFVIKHERDIFVLEEGVGGKDGIVWLNDGVGDLWGWVDGETELGFLAVIDRKSFEEEGSETRSSTTSDGVEDEESLETCAVISELSDSVEC
jgi:hypothetical protein